FASVVAGDEKLYVVSRDRGIFVLTATPEMEELAQNRMDPDDSVANASIAISQGRLHLRTDRFLSCIDNRSPHPGGITTVCCSPASKPGCAWAKRHHRRRVPVTEDGPAPAGVRDAR